MLFYLISLIIYAKISSFKGDKMVKNHKLIVKMIEIFKLDGKDYMGFSYSNVFELTYHHIQKSCDHGPTNVRNGAILTRYAHDFLNYLELNGPEFYEMLNKEFKELSLTEMPPTKYYWQRIATILEGAKKVHWDNFLAMKARDPRKKKKVNNPSRLERKRVKKDLRKYTYR